MSAYDYIDFGLERRVAPPLPNQPTKPAGSCARSTDDKQIHRRDPVGVVAQERSRGIRTKVNGRRDGQKSGGIPFGVGSLAHLLKNRFYIGEVNYRGEVYRGEHEPILTRDLFEAVQEKLAGNAVARQLRLKGSAAIPAGRLYDDRGNRMSPTHANKKGVRYRHYVSQALLQNRKAEAGSIARVPAPEIESLVCDGVRRQRAAVEEAEPAAALADRELIERHVTRVLVKPRTLEVRGDLAGIRGDGKRQCTPTFNIGPLRLVPLNAQP
jgi:site-specific DNA recombinase